MGELNNLYVSKSFQGLLKMTDSATGVTGTLQTVQTGDGTNTPLQISQTQINISGSFTVNGSPITGSAIDTGSFATTGSNTFIGNQIIEGNLSFPSNSFVSTDNVSGALYFSALNQGTLYINGDGGEGDVIVGYPAWQNSLKVKGGSTEITGSLGVTNIKGTGSLFLQPNQADVRYVEIYNTSPTDTHITGSGGQIFLGNDETYIKVDNYGSVKRIDIVADNLVNVSGSMSVTGSIDITGQYLVNGVAFSGGTNGSSGTSGSDGSSGTSGTSGQAGSSGTSGSNGSSGSSGVSPSVVGFITTGSIDQQQSITGSIDISNGNNATNLFVGSDKNIGLGVTFGDNPASSYNTIFNATSSYSALGTFDADFNFDNEFQTTVSRTNIEFQEYNQDRDYNFRTWLQVKASTSGTSGIKPIQLLRNTEVTGSLYVSSSIQKDVIIEGQLWVSTSLASTGTTTQAQVNVVGSTSALLGKTGSALISPQVISLTDNGVQTTNGFSLVQLGQSNTISSVGVFGQQSQLTIDSAGKSYIDMLATTQRGGGGRVSEILIETSPSGSIFRDLSIGMSPTSSPAIGGGYVWLYIPENISGSNPSPQFTRGLIDTGSITNVGDVYIFNPASNNSAVKFNITGSNSATGSNLIFGNTNVLTTQSGSVVITGSNNILLNGFRTSTVTAGTFGYINGNTNIVNIIPTIATGSFPIATTSNILYAAVILDGPVTSSFGSGSQVGTFSGNYTLQGNATTFRHKSGSFFHTANITLGSFSSFATSSYLDDAGAASPANTSNIFQGSATTVLNVSSSVLLTRNLINATSTTIENRFTNPTNYITNGSGSLTLTNNIFGGTLHTVLSSGSFTTNRQINNNLVAGYGNNLNQISSGSANTFLTNTAILGQGLIVSGSNTSATTTGGSTFVGRWNATGSLQESSQDTVFVVGSGTSAAARRNSLRIDSNGNTQITGSLSISGSLTVVGSVSGAFTGSLQGTASFATDFNKTGLITTGSAGNTQNITSSLIISSSLNVYGNINDLKIWTGSALVNSIGIGGNTLAGQTGVSPLNNVAIGNNALSTNATGSSIVAIGDGALQNSVAGFNLAVGSSALSANTTGQYNIGIGQSSYQANTVGNSNTAIGWNSGVNNVTGSTNTIIGAQALQNNASGSGNVAIGYGAGYYSTGSNGFYIGNDNYGSLSNDQNKSMMYGVFNGTTANQTLQINANTKITNNTTVTGSLSVTGSVYVTGSVQGNVNSLSIASNTASLNLANGNFYTLQLVSGSNTRIEPSNISQGQTVNILLSTTGSATVSFPTSVLQVSGSSYVPTTTTGKDIITLISFDNSSLYLANVKNLV